MPANWTFGKRLAFGFALAALVLLVVAASGYRSVAGLIDNNRWVAHTQDVRHRIAELMGAMIDAETGMRGYVVTGDEQFLDAHRFGAEHANAAFAELKRMTSDNAEQGQKVEVLGQKVEASLRFVADLVNLRRSQGFDVAQRVVSTADGKRLMDEVRQQIASIDASESELLQRREAEAEASASSTQAVMAWGSLVGTVLVALLGLYIARSLGAQVALAVRRIESSSAELQSAATQQATGAREQATAMNEISTTITELLATSRQISESAQRVAQIAEQTAAAARAGDITVRRGSDSMTGIRHQVETIVHHMLDLGKKSQQIGSVLEIVSELAEQTNILAINATIEAAGAGEAGKRFGVVADEIRKLADRVTGSTKEIRMLIDDVRSAVNTTVMTTETGSKAVEAGASQFVEISSAFSQIATQVTTTTEAAKEIGLSTKQQTTAVEQVNLAIANVTQATKETEVSTAQTLQTAQELSGLSRELMRIIERESARAA